MLQGRAGWKRGRPRVPPPPDPVLTSPPCFGSPKGTGTGAVRPQEERTEAQNFSPEGNSYLNNSGLACRHHRRRRRTPGGAVPLEAPRFRAPRSGQGVGRHTQGCAWRGCGSLLRNPFLSPSSSFLARPSAAVAVASEPAPLPAASSSLLPLRSAPSGRAGGPAACCSRFSVWVLRGSRVV